MPQHAEKLAVLFADICGSTALYESLGDGQARRLIAQCLSTMTGEIFACQGALIKTIGDEVMCAFPSAEAALHAACAMQSAVKNSRLEDNHSMHIRIGFHYGDASCEAGEIFGDTVNIAARVAAITRAGQIMTTLAAVNALPLALRYKTRQIMRAEFKEKGEQLGIYMVIWDPGDILDTRIGIPAYRKSQDNSDVMVLRYRDQSFRVNKERRSVALGRGDTCDIIVLNGFTSRQHTCVELRFGKFFLIDQSTNGTYVRFSGGNVVRVNREEITLQGSGSISMGQPYSKNPVDLVEFSITPIHV